MITMTHSSFHWCMVDDANSRDDGTNEHDRSWHLHTRHEHENSNESVNNNGVWIAIIIAHRSEAIFCSDRSAMQSMDGMNATNDDRWRQGTFDHYPLWITYSLWNGSGTIACLLLMYGIMLLKVYDMHWSVFIICITSNIYYYSIFICINHYKHCHGATKTAVTIVLSFLLLILLADCYHV